MYDYGEYVSPNAVAFDGSKGDELHNAYPIQYQKVAYDFFMSKVCTWGYTSSDRSQALSDDKVPSTATGVYDRYSL